MLASARPRRRSSRCLALLAAVSLTAACGGASDESDGPTTAPPTPVSTTLPATLPPTSVPGTSTSSPGTSTTSATTTVEPGTSTTGPTWTTSAPTTSTTTPTTTAPACAPIGDRGDEQAGFPGSLSSLVGVEIRTGAHPCYERIVIEFAPGDAPTPAIVPGWWVRYTDGPITLGQTDDQFVELRGDANLLITVEAWMYEVDANGRPTTYAGGIDLFPTNVSTIEEIRLIDNWEGVQVWAVGLDRVRDLRVTVLTEPVRLVIDLGA